MQAFLPFDHQIPNEPLFSCLCVTEDRPAFLEWLLWNYDKQDLVSRELVVVDSSWEPWPLPAREDMRVVRCSHGATVAHKRNLAVDAARGRLVTWFDDDDWQHPSKLSVLAAALEGPAEVAGPTRSWFVDVARARAREYRLPRGVLFNGLGVRREALRLLRFDERQVRGADTQWLRVLQERVGQRPAKLDEVLSLWLSHRDNLSNPATRLAFPHPLDVVRTAIGAAAWGDTDERLGALRARLGPAPGAAQGIHLRPRSRHRAHPTGSR